jgi:hypothetical protein
MRHIRRRDFLKAVPVAAGAISSAAAANAPRQGETAAETARPRISEAPYSPVADYPIRPKSYFEVTVSDAFWKRKIDTNARVTIPFEVRKLTDAGRSLNGNVLEAAILSLKTHPDRQLRAIVDARIAELKTERWRGNSGFEVAAAYYNTTGRKDLLEHAARAADDCRSK